MFFRLFPATHERRLSRNRALRSLALALSVVPCLVGAAAAQSTIEEFLIVADRGDDGGGPSWTFLVELDGAGITSATVTPPSGPVIVLTDVSGFGDTFEFEDGPFTTFTALQLAYPAGSYSLLVDGTESATVVWDPTEPVGTSGPPSVSITSPAAGSSTFDTTPDVAYSLDCTNCNDLSVEFFDAATDGDIVSFEGLFLDTTPLPNPVSFASLTSNNLRTDLDRGSMFVEVISGLADFSLATLSPSGQSFQYVEAATVFHEVQFVVSGVDDLLVAGAREDQGSGPAWRLYLEVDGEGLSSATVLPPLGPMITLDDGAGLGEVFEFESAPFASFASLQATYPAGSYAFTIDGSETVTVTWNPTAPLGASGEPSLAITSPSDGTSGVGSTPDVAYTLDCSNCNDLFVSLYDVATDGAAASFFRDVVDTALLPNPVAFSSLTPETPAMQLPNGLNEVELAVGLTNESTPSLSPSGQVVDYLEVAALLDVSTFTVPEPGAAASGAAALLVLAALSAARRRRD